VYTKNVTHTTKEPFLFRTLLGFGLPIYFWVVKNTEEGELAPYLYATKGTEALEHIMLLSDHDTSHTEVYTG
jgi:hypothetical protein